MLIRKPVIKKQQWIDDELLLTLFIDSHVADFKGHFPDFPILPGVSQIDWVIFYGQTLLHCPEQFSGMEVIKFQEPIFANSDILLSLKWDADKGKLYFKYTSIGKQHSSGRINLVDA